MDTNLDKLVSELCRLPKETEWVEFKHNNCEPHIVGQDICALANSAALRDRDKAYMLWGVDDETHAVVGTRVNLSQETKGGQELENWLRSMLSTNVDFEMHHFAVGDKWLDLLIIGKAAQFPVTFQQVEYIRIGSYTKKLHEYKALQGQLWAKLQGVRFEDIAAKSDLAPADLLRLLDVGRYFDLLRIPQPTDIEAALHYLEEDGLVRRQDNGLYTITNLGAILFAKRLREFDRLARKALRVVRYEGLTKYTLLKNHTTDEGYALCFENTVELISAYLPSKENVQSALRDIEEQFPLPAIREAVANALIHQDFFVSGMGPVVEIFDNRVEVTNPGTPLVDIMRIIDNPPRSRNEKLASLMRRLDMCEELGRGWDRMVMACEAKQMPAPRIRRFEECTVVTVFQKQAYADIPMEERLWALYLHACLRHVQGSPMSNKTVCERFGINRNSAAMATRLIKKAIEQHLIEPLDDEAANRNLRYLPIWK